MTSLLDDSERTLELLHRWKAGDRIALDQLLTEVHPWLHRELSKALAADQRATQDSMDLAQTAITNFLSWGPRFVPESAGQFRGLLLRIAKNEVIDRQRRLARHGRGRHFESLDGSDLRSGFGGAQPTSQQPSGEAVRSEESAWVRLALQFLEPDERYLLLASDVDGDGWEAIANELGMASADAARMRAARLKPRLARMLVQLRSGRVPPDA